MMSLNMENLIDWFLTNGSLFAVIATVGVAILLISCLGCTDCPCREQDELFRHRHV